MRISRVSPAARRPCRSPSAADSAICSSSPRTWSCSARITAVGPAPCMCMRRSNGGKSTCSSTSMWRRMAGTKASACARAAGASPASAAASASAYSASQRRWSASIQALMVGGSPAARLVSAPRQAPWPCRGVHTNRPQRSAMSPLSRARGSPGVIRSSSSSGASASNARARAAACSSAGSVRRSSGVAVMVHLAGREGFLGLTPRLTAASRGCT